MIISAKQYEELRHELFRQSCPNLWALLNTPFGSRIPPRVVGEKWQRKALNELRAMAKFPVPDRLYLDFDPADDPPASPAPDRKEG